MMSLHAVMYMYTINSSYDILVLVKDATARYCTDLFINLYNTLTDWNRFFSTIIVHILFHKIQQAQKEQSF